MLSRRRFSPRRRRDTPLAHFTLLPRVYAVAAVDMPMRRHIDIPYGRCYEGATLCCAYAAR